jgi:N-methylhydantoinase A
MQADFRYDVVRAKVMPIDSIDAVTLDAEFRDIQDEVRAALLKQRSGGAEVMLPRFIDVQYIGQDSPLTLPFPDGTADLRADVTARFREAHRVAFGYSREDAAEIVSLRIHGTASAGGASIAELAQAAAPVSLRGELTNRQAIFADLKPIEVAVIDRTDLNETPRAGPMIVEEWDTSVVVPPGWAAQRDRLGNIVLTSGGSVEA